MYTLNVKTYVCGFPSHLRIFHSYGDITMTGDGLQILTYARHLWTLNSEGSLACHTSCEAGHPFIMLISQDPWHIHLLPSVWQWSCHYLFLRLWSVIRLEHQTFHLWGDRLNPPCHRCRKTYVKHFKIQLKLIT